MRSISDKTGKALKAATRRSIDMAGGPEGFQHATRVRQGQLSKYGLAGADHADCFIPLDVALEADLEAGSPIIASELARLQGYRLVRADGQPQPTAPISHKDLLALSVEFSDVQRVANEALANDHVDYGERRDIRRELEELRKALADFEAKLGEG